MISGINGSEHTYNAQKRNGCMDMKRVIGFALFWIAVGLILSLILPNTFIEVISIILCILAGYNLFCC